MIWTNDGFYRGARLGTLLALALTACGDDGAVTSDTDDESTGTTEGPSTNPSTSASATSPSTTTNPSTTGMTSPETDTDSSSSTTMEEDTTTTTGDTDTTGPDIECGNDILEDGEDCDGTDLGDETCVTQGADEGELACAKDCTFDVSACVMYSCGNDILEGRELCDTDQLQDETCEGLAFTGGTLACADNCMDYDTSGCYTCGDDVTEEPEVCDGTDIGDNTCVGLGFDGGTPGCADDCSAIDDSGCYICGDNEQEGPEVCDGTDLADETCESQGFIGGGTLLCAAGCGGFDTSGCSDTLCSAPGTQIGPNLGTLTVDTITVPTVGAFVADVNVAINATHTFVADLEMSVRHVETDVRVNLADDQCTSGDNVGVRYDQEGAALVCSATPPAITGTVLPLGNLDTYDGISDPAGSWELTIRDDANGDQGVLTDWCVTITTAETSPQVCGDGSLQFGEPCDTDLLGTPGTCVGIGYLAGGTLACADDCTYDVSGCLGPQCGNATAEDPEECDGVDLAGNDCSALGYDGGELGCGATCQFDETGCYACGDSVVEPDVEECDTNELDTTRCEDLGFVGGSLGCNACTFDSADCSDDVIAVCTSPALTINGTTPNVNSTIDLMDLGNVADVDVFLRVDHAWMGDLDINLINDATGTSVNLISDQCDAAGEDNMWASFNDEGSGLANCIQPFAIEGNLTPEQTLTAFDGAAIAGTWRINVVDDFPGADHGTFHEWCIYITPQ